MTAWAGAAGAGVAATLKVVGASDLEGGAPYDDVAVAGPTAVVATGACPGGAVKVVDLRDARRPSVVATVSLPPGTVAADLDADPSGIVAVALASCSPGSPGGVSYYDVSDPTNPRPLSQSPACSGCAVVALAQTAGDRVLAVRPVAPETLEVDDVLDPAHPAPVGRWSASPPARAGACPAGRIRSVAVRDGGQAALAVLDDGRVFDLDLADPARPTDAGGTAPPDPATAGRAGSAAVLPLGTRTLAIVGEEGGGGCPGERTHGLRLLDVRPGTPPRELDPLRFPTAAIPGRLVASGELVYVAWHGDGVRVVDLGQVRARAVAQFVPTHPDVVGVALLADHVLVVDRESGLYVLDRPDEGGARSSFWSQLSGLLPYLGVAGFLAAAFLVPRLAMGHAPQETGASSPAPQPARRRRSGA